MAPPLPPFHVANGVVQPAATMTTTYDAVPAASDPMMALPHHNKPTAAGMEESLSMPTVFVGGVVGVGLVLWCFFTFTRLLVSHAHDKVPLDEDYESNEDDEESDRPAPAKGTRAEL